MESLITKIKTTLMEVSEIKEIFDFPLQGNPTKFPAVIFYPVSMDNAFSTTKENEKIYRFTMYVVFSLNGTNVEAIYKTQLPKIHDKIVAQFDADWNFGTDAGHRIWGRISASNLYLLQEKEKIATAEFMIEIKRQTTN
jgi:hypothetical protein